MEKEANPDMIVITSKSKNDYSEEKIELIVTSKLKDISNQEIADALGRSYWSVVYKWQDIKKNRLKKEQVVYLS